MTSGEKRVSREKCPGWLFCCPDASDSGGISLAFCGLLGNFIMRVFELVKYLIWYLMAVSTVLAEKSVHKSGE